MKGILQVCVLIITTLLKRFKYIALSIPSEGYGIIDVGEATGYRPIIFIFISTMIILFTASLSR